MSEPESRLLEVDGLSVSFGKGADEVTVVKDVSFVLHAGETLGLVGESGSGKSVTSLAVMGLVGHQGGRVSAGSIRLDGTDVTGLSARQWRRVHGEKIGMVFQQPIRSLDPSFTVGEQIAESVRRHRGSSRSEARQVAVDMLARVKIRDPERRASEYPHTFSGGMAQRVMIAMALACSPKVLIADEPTTALDVTVQSAILDLLVELQHDLGIGIVFISHDLGVVAEISDRVAVMYAGEVVETATTSELLTSPKHPYSLSLLRSIPRIGQGRRLVAIPGRVPPMDSMPEGCRFHPRCSLAVESVCCRDDVPLLALPGGRHSRCNRVEALEKEVAKL
ncbi:ABC transporter ATP-binding protein [Nocardioides massiliensis]|uniref:Oligopeptide/dipeptide ABC transporter ATP-binding protein n=1 Tax=Nocardioides massiliensis TaxID=1325935 RepID=A0ABT9NK35_9ACTN|nr:ABC transporter ATP-binding protein [Nocardioides massiliensis]MDP9820776.1 oligopeptide/dipeptide ABC transporter ATP-binding protein [Nocardioides massiliensis]